MNKQALWAMFMGIFAGGEDSPPISIPSHKITQARQHTEPSKQKLNRKKGKKTRKNRGKSKKSTAVDKEGKMTIKQFEKLTKLLPKNPRKAHIMLMVFELMMKMEKMKNRGK